MTVIVCTHLRLFVTARYEIVTRKATFVLAIACYNVFFDELILSIVQGSTRGVSLDVTQVRIAPPKLRETAVDTVKINQIDRHRGISSTLILTRANTANLRSPTPSHTGPFL